MIIKKLKKWFYDKFLNRYLVEYHPQFINYVDIIDPNPDIFTKNAAKEYRRIMKMLKSKKYQKYFFKAIKYEPNTTEPKIEPFSTKVFDRIKRAISIQYLRFFNKKLYHSLQIFRNWNSKVIKFDVQITEYMKNTTPIERAERAVLRRVSTTKRVDALKRLENIKKKRVAAIHENNLV